MDQWDSIQVPECSANRRHTVIALLVVVGSLALLADSPEATGNRTVSPAR